MNQRAAFRFAQATACPTSWFPTPTRTPSAGVTGRPSEFSDQAPLDALAHDWTEEEVVFLHWRLLQDVQDLSDPATPLDEKLSTLRWIFTEPDKDERPFSFVSCLRVVGCSPLSPIAYCGQVDSEEVRDFIAGHVRHWLSETLTNYPDWVREALSQNPAWVETQLSRNPQWINEQIRRVELEGDLFA